METSPYAAKYKMFFWEHNRSQKNYVMLTGTDETDVINFTLPVSPGFESLHLEWYSYKGIGIAQGSRSDTATLSVYRKSLTPNYFLDALHDPSNISDVFISYSQSQHLDGDTDRRGTLGIVGETLGNGLAFLPLTVELTRDNVPLVFTNFEEAASEGDDNASPESCPNMNISRLTLNDVEKCTANYRRPPTQLIDYIGALMGRAVMVISYDPKKVKIGKVYDVITQSGVTQNAVYMPFSKEKNLNRSEMDAEYGKLAEAGVENPVFIYRYSATMTNEHNYYNYTIKNLYDNDEQIPDYIRGIKLDISIPPQDLDDFFMVDMGSKFVPTESGHNLYHFLQELKQHNLLVIRDLQIFGDYTAQIAQGTSTRYGILRPAVLNEYNLGVHAFLTTQPEHLLPIRQFVLAKDGDEKYIQPPKYNVLNLSLTQADGKIGSGKLKFTYDNPPLFQSGDKVVVEMSTMDGQQVFQQKIVPTESGGEILVNNLQDGSTYKTKVYTKGGSKTSLPINLIASPSIPQVRGINHIVKDNNTIVLNINLDSIDSSNITKIIVRPINRINEFAQESKTLNISKRYTTLQSQLDSKKVFCYNVSTNKIPVEIPRGHAQTMEIFLLSGNNVASQPTTYRAANVLPILIHNSDRPDEIDFNFSIASEELMGAELPLFDANTIGLDNIDIYQEGELGFDDMQEGAEGSLSPDDGVRNGDIINDDGEVVTIITP